MSRKLFTAALTAACLSAPALANDRMNDLEIAHSAYTAGNIDIRYAHLALATSEHAQVREFAGTMIRDHTAVNEAAAALVKNLNVTPQDNDLSRTLIEGAAKKRAELSALNGKAFDCAYAKNEVGYHRIVNQTVESNFIPNAKVPELKELLSDALATFKVHQGHAERMLAALSCGS